MKTITKLLAASAAALSMSAASAQAAIYISFDGSTDEAVFADGPFNFIADCNVSACGGWDEVSVGGNAPPRPQLLHSNNVDVNDGGSGPASLTVWITRTGLAPMGDDFFSSLTSNNLGGGISVHLETLVSNTNQKYGGTVLGSFDHSGNGAASSNQYDFFDASASGVYSVTHKYIITATAQAGDRSASPTIALGVPEPATWALMIMGFGGAGAMLRTQRRKLVRA